MRNEILLNAMMLGYNEETNTSTKKTIVTAACNIICYDYGFKTPSKGTNFLTWYYSVFDAQFGKGSYMDVGSSKYNARGNGTYVDCIEDHTQDSF